MQTIEQQIRRRLAELDADEPYRRRTRRRRSFAISGAGSQSHRCERLTDDFVNGLEPREREFVVQDELVERLVLRVRRSGAKTYYVTYPSNAPHAKRRIAIGSTADLTVDQARLLVIDRLEREALGEKQSAHARLPGNVSVEEACRAYFEHQSLRRGARYGRHVHKVLSILVDAYPHHRLSRLRRDVLLSFIEKSAAADPPRGRALHKTLRAFLTWCVDVGAVEGNVIARTMSPLLPSAPRRNLRHSELLAIYAAAENLARPWNVMIGFMMLTGSTVETARNLHRIQVDLDKQLWSDERCNPWDLPQRWTPLSQHCTDLLQRLAAPKEFFFQSPISPGAMFLRRSVLQQLQRSSGVDGWSWRDLVRSTQAEMRGAPSAHMLTRGGIVLSQDEQRKHFESWAEVLQGARAERPAHPFEDDEVVL